jgi:hypothetical protein
MSVDIFSRSLPFIFGLLTFIALELVLLLVILLPLLARVVHAKTSEGPEEPKLAGPELNSNHAAGAMLSRIEVVLVAPELIEVLRKLAPTSTDPESACNLESRQAYQVSEEQSGDLRAGHHEGQGPEKKPETGRIPVPAKGRNHELPLVIVSRAGSLEKRTAIGHVQSVGVAEDQLYDLKIDALLARALVFKIADRVGLLRDLKINLTTRGNYEDPLRLILHLGLIKMSAPVLRNPKSEEVEFSPDFIPEFGGRPAPSLVIDDRTRPFTISIGRAFSEKEGSL